MKNIPGLLLHALAGELQQLGDDSTIQRSTPIGGGCIHAACRIETAQHAYMLKWNTNPLPRIFLTEKFGLERIRSTGTVRVPEVYSAADAEGDRPAFILMEWIDSLPGQQNRFDQALLGRQLAALHRSEPPAGVGGMYGFEQDNYIGRSVQINAWRDDWIAFFRENRLLPQIGMAEAGGQLPAQRKKRLLRMIDRLEQWLSGVHRRPSLLHGDLWGGNVIAGASAEPVLLDPAVYYGDREMDLAFTELFGGFDQNFYRGYQESWQLDNGYEKRKHLYNLYHLINHLNHFGESYGSAVDRTLDGLGM